MRIILTHEQTDFDGLASLLGAYLLDESAIPVLPRRMNRNVRAFMTIYGADLPFVDPRDLNDQTIEAVALVDTQSLTSIKGMTPKTRVSAIDHHTPRQDLPANWELTFQETGANTTIFAESIQERDVHLSVVQATLLLLGIYEDTGSLTYTRTTPRDVRAAAFLLEQGASLTIAHDYINHPLSLQQQEIYDQLRQDAEPHTIHNYTVIVSQGDARGMDEELSTVAHKMRDLLDPDAILLLINIRGGVQLIARSTSDQINVAKLAAHFGGGGHARAAAALIKNKPREEVHAELIEVLPKFVQPGVTVAEIMSRAPQILHPTTPVQEISRRMQRYGYEGYPVVENNEILGLVTRRAVDRALSHKLNLTASNLMESGNVHVHPDHSIDYLQNVMTDTGWGQIPVVERSSHNIIGIVTRTDLLKTLAPQVPIPGRRNLGEKLESALPAARLELLKEVAAIAQEQRTAIYIVGGFVRDLLMGLPSLDFDIVVEGDAIELAKAVQAQFGGRITTHKRFGTAKWFLKKPEDRQQKTNHSPFLAENGSHLPATLDFITARTEFYTQPTVLPTVESGSIKLDLHRRDFTINTLALRLDGHHFGDLHDYWGGYNDLRQGLVRVLHSLSFIDDPTRILRAVRYEQRYNFKIGKRTQELLLEARPLIERISGDRVRHELDNILAEERAIPMLTRLKELGILEAIHPDLKWDAWIEAQFAKIELPAPEWNMGPELKGQSLYRVLAYTLWLMRLPAPKARKVAKRLRVARVIAETVQNSCELWQKLPVSPDARPSELVELFDKVTPAALYAVYSASNDEELCQNIYAYITTWRQIKPQNTGDDLQARDLPPGPHYKEILTRLRQAWLDGEVNSPEAEAALLDQLASAVLNSRQK
ncbi:MAG: CBS domain-containing protein [Anaerolineales bacterium]